MGGPHSFGLLGSKEYFSPEVSIISFRIVERKVHGNCKRIYCFFIYFTKKRWTIFISLPQNEGWIILLLRLFRTLDKYSKTKYYDSIVQKIVKTYSNSLIKFVVTITTGRPLYSLVGSSAIMKCRDRSRTSDGNLKWLLLRQYNWLTSILK